jgi:hypothetical protein
MCPSANRVGTSSSGSQVVCRTDTLFWGRGVSPSNCRQNSRCCHPHSGEGRSSGESSGGAQSTRPAASWRSRLSTRLFARSTGTGAIQGSFSMVGRKTLRNVPGIPASCAGTVAIPDGRLRRAAPVIDSAWCASLRFVRAAQRNTAHQVVSHGCIAVRSDRADFRGIVSFSGQEILNKVDTLRAPSPGRMAAAKAYAALASSKLPDRTFTTGKCQVRSAPIETLPLPRSALSPEALAARFLLACVAVLRCVARRLSHGTCTVSGRAR